MVFNVCCTCNYKNSDIYKFVLSYYHTESTTPTSFVSTTGDGRSNLSGAIAGAVIGLLLLVILFIIIAVIVCCVATTRRRKATIRNLQLDVLRR